MEEDRARYSRGGKPAYEQRPAAIFEISSSENGRDIEVRPRAKPSSLWDKGRRGRRCCHVLSQMGEIVRKRPIRGSIMDGIGRRSGRFLFVFSFFRCFHCLYNV